MRNIINWFKRLFGFGAVVEVPAPTPADVGASTLPPVTGGASTPDNSMSASNVRTGVITGASEAEKQMINLAISYVKRVIVSPEFKKAVLAFDFTNTNGLTNEQIYNLYTKSKLTVNVDDYSGSWKENHIWHTEGYENGDGFVHANRYFIHDAIQMMSLIFHELAHDPLGLHHDSATEYTSVPYGMNAISTHVAAQLGIRVNAEMVAEETV